MLSEVSALSSAVALSKKQRRDLASEIDTNERIRERNKDNFEKKNLKNLFKNQPHAN